MAAYDVELGVDAPSHLDLYRETHGRPTDQPPLLLLHGGGSTIDSNFGALLPWLTPTRQVLAVELQGHGRTPSTGRTPSFECSADDVAAVLADHQLPTGVDVLGFSNGGHVALQLAIRHPHLVRRQIIASASFRRDGMIEGFWEGLASATTRDLPVAYRREDERLNPHRPHHTEELFATDQGQMMRFEDWDEKTLRAITCPTLVVAADRDVVRPSHSVDLASLIPDARLLIVPGNHGDYLGELLGAGGDTHAMHRTLPFLLDFLDGTDPTH